MNQLLRKYAMQTTNEGRMENMSQLLKKCALLAACVALALCFTTRSAHAQMVDMSGTGEHLFFGYWSTANYMNTQLNVHSPLGVRDSGEPMNVVHIRLRSAAPDAPGAPNTVVSFNICLTPGDSWTAAMSSDGLMVADPGECDEMVAQSLDTRTVTHVATPKMGEMVPLSADSGYAEAWVRPMGGLKDDSVPCTAADILADGRCGTDAVVGGVDPDVAPDNAMAMNISGLASLVAPMSGFSSSYNAVALTQCGDRTDDNNANTLGTATTIMAATTDVGGNGCWHVETTGTPLANSDVAGAPIMAALNSPNRDLLTGRWTSIADDNVMSHTKLVVTFAGGNPLLYTGYDKGGVDVRAEASGVDPLTTYVFDDTGYIALRSHEVELGMGVNMCMFGHGMMDGDMMDGDMMDGDMMPMLSCNGMEVGMIDGMSGEFRIFNNTAAAVAARAPALPTDGTVAQPETEGSRQITNSGKEAVGIGAADVAATAAVDEGAQVPDGGPLPAIGLVFSYFMGTDGTQYDQVTPMQWISIDTDDTGADDTGLGL